MTRFSFAVLILLCGAVFGQNSPKETNPENKTTLENVLGADKSLMWTTSGPISTGPMVRVLCETYVPKPKGCAILDGQTLDDLVEAMNFAQRSQRAELDELYHQTDYLLDVIEKCRQAKLKPTKEAAKKK